MELRTSDGTLVDVDAGEQAFHAAMAAPEPDQPPDYPAPPRRGPDAGPRTPRGRKTSADKPRTAKSVPGTKRGGDSGRSASAKPDRKAGVDGALQVAGGILVVFPSTRADAGALAEHAPELSKAIVATAEQDERFARAVDKLLNTGPYAALVMAVVPLAAQIAANHKLLPVGFMGTEDPAKIRAEVEKSLSPEDPETAEPVPAAA